MQLIMFAFFVAILLHASRIYIIRYFTNMILDFFSQKALKLGGRIVHGNKTFEDFVGQLAIPMAPSTYTS